MGKIRPLSEELIKKIAAGQVIERPSSVVKELVENSLDAKSTFIKVELENGGIDYIKVSDDGIGMDKDDILSCFKSHTTSKIVTEEDLLSVLTMGFRGEALYSIATISNLIIKSKGISDLNGYFCEIENGIVINHGSIGAPQGTAVIVKSLFNSIPARRKFLKSNKTELRYVIDTIVPYCLSYPEVGFYLSHNKRVIFDLPPSQSVTERISDLMGGEISRYLIPVLFDDVHFKISGFITRPQVASPNKNKQYLFVNRRHVTSSIVSDSVKDAYGTLLQPRLFPTFILFIELSPSLVDVNIHPRKEKVAFTDEAYIYDLFYKCISNSFSNEESTYVKDTPVHELLNDNLKDDYKINIPSTIYQVHNLYLIKHLKDGVLVVDQHAAHERIIYERLLDSYRKGNFSEKCFPQNTITFSLPISDSYILDENLAKINDFGLNIENFGKNIYKIISYPKMIKEESIKSFVEEILVLLKEGRGFNTLNTHVKHVLSTMACKSAIKSGDYLSEEDREILLSDLEKTTTKYTCPHGRPVKMEITLNELARMFKRK